MSNRTADRADRALATFAAIDIVGMSDSDKQAIEAALDVLFLDPNEQAIEAAIDVFQRYRKKKP